MKPSLPIRFVYLLALLLMGAQVRGQVVRYRDSSSPRLWTPTEVDTFRQVMNRRGRTAGIEFHPRIDKTITRPDTIIYEYTLMGTHTQAALAARQQGLDGFIGQPLPAFALPDVQGKLVNSASLRGKPVVLNLWFTTCSPCIAEMPTLNRIQHEKARSEIVFLAMTFDSQQQVQAFLRKQAFTYRQLVEAKQYCSQFGTGFPVTFFVGRDGLIKKVLGGIAVNADPVTHKPTSADDAAFYAALKQIE
ncbi:TlpA family protein disulfide reductase [Hymenobacter sp. RP-2-7]|uniref:TlpA family protein disulfide reductase n=1 Tax=Hymenobacter polaris TaxID=2682546 RepID=A0A7Y0FLP2_9BACT|nr:TlpA disulfide reductase family protein [Hymenobacter polaris]NML65008.1 TlpA family protein disulfide reductase [Hymenobacter polaris]